MVWSHTFERVPTQLGQLFVIIKFPDICIILSFLCAGRSFHFQTTPQKPKLCPPMVMGQPALPTTLQRLLSPLFSCHQSPSFSTKSHPIHHHQTFVITEHQSPNFPITKNNSIVFFMLYEYLYLPKMLLGPTLTHF